MRKGAIFIVLALLLMLGAAPVYANGISPLPHAFYGGVTINGSPAPAGATIEARGAGVLTGIKDNPIITTESGKFGKAGALEPKLIVQGDILEGATITFYVNGHSTGQTAEWHSGEVTELNLSATISGGGPGGAPPSEPGITDVSDYVDEDGKLTQDVTAESEDGKVELFIEEDIIGLTEEGEPLSEISIIEMEEPPDPPEDSNVIGLVYDFGPDGATFDQPITLTFTYDPALLPEGVCEECLSIAMWDGANWVELEGPFTIDLENNTIRVPISHFTPFASIAYTDPAAFTVSDLAISPAEVDVGETVTISLLVTNTGCLAGSYEVTLKIDGEKVASEDVILAGRASKEVSFTTSKDEPGTYSVDVNGLTGSFTVKEELVPVVPTAFTVSDLFISPSEVYIGETVSISVLVTNTGGESGSCVVTLKINGVVEATKEVTLAPRASESITFTTSKDIAGTYSVEVDGLTGSFIVKEKVVPPVVPVVPPVIPKPINWPLIGGIIGGVIVIGLLVYFLIVRRRRVAKGLDINLFGEVSKWRISYSDRLLEAVDITSKDGKINIYIPEDTFCLNEKGNRLKGLVIKVEEEAPEPPKDCLILGKAYDIGPNGAAFDSYLRLTLAYEEEDIPEGIEEENLYIAYYGKEWVPLDSTVDTEGNKVSANVPHLTIFAIFGYLNP